MLASLDVAPPRLRAAAYRQRLVGAQRGNELLGQDTRPLDFVNTHSGGVYKKTLLMMHLAELDEESRRGRPSPAGPGLASDLLSG